METKPVPNASDEGVRRFDGRRSDGRSLVAESLARGSLLLVLAGLIAFFSLLDGGLFFSGDNLRLILTAQAVTGVIALAVTVALVTGEVDLSVAGTMGTVSALVADRVVAGVNPVVAVLMGLGIAAGVGLLNGALVTYGRLSSIIATLATGTLATGIGLALVGPETVVGLDQSFVGVFATDWGGVQAAFYMLIALTAGAVALLQRTLLGRRLFFVGQNREAAALLGIRVRRLTFGGLVTASLLAGFAGVMLAGQNGSANVTETGGYLLPAFAASFLGTSTIVPGRFNAGGTLVATYVMGTAAIGLNVAGVPQWSSYLFNGGLLIIALAMFTFLKLRRERLAKRGSMRQTEADDAAEVADGADD
ncbi:ABC transporter permease [Streptomyces puniciscabiei]